MLKYVRFLINLLGRCMIMSDSFFSGLFCVFKEFG